LDLAQTSPRTVYQRNTNEEGVEPSLSRGFDRNANKEGWHPPRCSKIQETQTRRALNPPRCSKLKETPTRRVLNPPRRMDMTKTWPRRAFALPSLRNPFRDDLVIKIQLKKRIYIFGVGTTASPLPLWLLSLCPCDAFVLP
jgi:hypothetical protein